MLRKLIRLRVRCSPLGCALLVAMSAAPSCTGQDDWNAERAITLYLHGKAMLDDVRTAAPAAVVAELEATSAYRQGHPREIVLGPGAVLGFVHGEITLGKLEGRTLDELRAFFAGLDPALSRGDIDAARRIGEALVCYEPFEASFHEGLARAYTAGGRQTDADRQHGLALRLDPSVGRPAERAVASGTIGVTGAASVASPRSALSGATLPSSSPAAAANAAAQRALLALKDFVDPELLQPLMATALRSAAATPAEYADEFLTANDYFADLQEAQRHTQTALQAAAAGLWPEAGEAFWHGTISAESASMAWPQISANVACLLQTASAAAEGLGGEVRGGRDRASAAAARDAAPIFRQRALQAAQLLAQLQGTSFDHSAPPASVDPQNNVPQYGPVQSYFDSTMNQMMWGH